MSDEIMLVFGEDGVAREYDDTWDITIHCESEEDQKVVLEKLNNSNQEAKHSSGLISRQEAIDVLGVFTQADALGHTPKQIVEALPSVQPEREKGEWTKDCACEICGFKPWYERDIHTLSFCPNCGADMREDQDG